MKSNDAQFIEQNGGSTRLSRLLGLPDKGGPQRVQNWKKRGIPAQVKLDWPEIFMVPAADTTPKAAQHG